MVTSRRCGRDRPPQEPFPVPRLKADPPNQVRSWDVTFLSTSVRKKLNVKARQGKGAELGSAGKQMG